MPACVCWLGGGGRRCWVWRGAKRTQRATVQRPTRARTCNTRARKHTQTRTQAHAWPMLVAAGGDALWWLAVRPSGCQPHDGFPHAPPRYLTTLLLLLPLLPPPLPLLPLRPATHAIVGGVQQPPATIAITHKNCACLTQLQRAGCRDPADPEGRNSIGCWHAVLQFWQGHLCYSYKGLPEEQQLSDPPADARDGAVQWRRTVWARVRACARTPPRPPRSGAGVRAVGGAGREGRRVQGRGTLCGCCEHNQLSGHAPRRSCHPRGWPGCSRKLYRV